MEKKKKPFFINVKNAIVNFDEYKIFSEEKTSLAIKYFFKLLLIFVLIFTIALICRIINISNNFISDFKNECPEFSFNNYVLEIKGDNKKIVKGDDSGYFGLIIDSQNDNLSDVKESSNYQRVIGILKDKVVIKNVDGVESFQDYKQLNERYDISNLNKSKVLDFFSRNNLTKIYTIIGIVFFIYLFVVYLIEFMLDILMLSVVGYLFSRIVRIKLKYKSLFNLSVYSLTLSILLYLIYIIANLFTGFTIRYFEVAYHAISYIYIVTAILMIRSDLVKQQIEVSKIVKEQKKIREEKQDKENKNDREEDKKEEETKNEKKEHKKEKDIPEGNEA